MARPKRTTVDYYPHYVKCGRTIYILEARFGNDGYAFWFKVLEVLGESEGHFYDCSVSSNWEYLLAKTRVNAQTATEIIGVLINLGKIDKELWEKNRVIWIENFVNNLTEVYRTRRTELPQKPVFKEEKQQSEKVISEKTPDKEPLKEIKPAKGEKSKGEESKEKYPYQDIVAMWNSVCLSCPKVLKVTEARKQKMKTRFQEFGVKREELTDYVMRLFQRVQASDFLTGRSTDKMGWVANFDWVFENEKNWVKVSEGNYDNKRGGGSNTAQKPVQAADGSQVQLGVGEYIDGSGRRTYGTGRANIPMTAAPRPSERYSWDAASHTWILQ